MFNKKTALLGAVVACGVSSVASAEVKATLGGAMDTQYGVVQQKTDFKYGSTFSQVQSNKTRTSALSNSGAVSVNVDGSMEGSELKYGGLMKFNANTSDAKGFGIDHSRNSEVDKNVLKQAMMYVETPFGKVEAGSTPSVGSAMQVGANQLMAAPNDFIYYVNPSASTGTLVRDTFLQSANLYTNDEGIVGTRTLNANKINFYSPRYMGFMLGVSYTPDLAVMGTSSSAMAASRYSTGATSYKDVVQGGVHFENTFNDVGVKAAVLGESGTSKIAPGSEKQRKLSGYETGLQVSYMGISLGGSMGSHQKSQVVKTASVKETKYYTVGAAYSYGPATASVTYMDSRKGIANQAKANKLEQLTFGLNYNVAEGFAPYASVTNFKFKNKATNAMSNKGNVFLVGSKLTF